MQIETLQILPDNSGAAGATVLYICKILFVNTAASDVTPALDHFVFASARPQHASYRALTSGIPPDVTVTNPMSAVRVGDKQEYTLVFRPATGATGTIAYQP